MSIFRQTTLVVVLTMIAGCAVNPVTGQRELGWVTTEQELDIGAQQYGPSRQMQGGDYVVDPELSEYVNEVGQSLATVSNRSLPYEFKVLNSSVPNAWALPGGKIAVNRGLLLELQSESELAAVLGHEIVHAAARHGAKAMERGMLLQGGVLATAIGSRDSDFGNLVVGGASVAAQLVNQKHGRQAELQADKFGMGYMAEAGYEPQGAVTLQETFVRLSEERRQDWLSGLFASHPPSQERVDKNRQTAQTLNPGGIRERDRYQQRIAALKKAQPAYEAFDKGLEALKEGDTAMALSLAQKAIDLEPREGHFYALRGDVRQKQKDYEKARVNYTSALGKNPDYFYYYLQRGLTNERLRDDTQAESDLQASVDLLPTATAFNALGSISERNGNLPRAKEYYRAASDSSSGVGRSAYASLVRLDLPDNPGAYLSVRTGLDDDGLLVVEVTNPTVVDVQQIGLTIRFQDSQGRVRQTTREVRRLPANTKTRLLTRLGPFTDTRQYQVDLTRARIVE